LTPRSRRAIKIGSIAGGYARVQAVCDYVHDRLCFSYPEARSTRTAAHAMDEHVGVCRDFTHLAVTLCRCLNIPARYCNGYLGESACRQTPRRWILTPGSKLMSAVAGTPLTPATTRAGSGAS
jgi:transglutaminase-like putative cysteine protease